MPNKSPVVITRPFAQAQDFALKIQAMGRDAVIFPLLDIHALTDPEELASFDAELARLHAFALVAFVSPNAIHAMFDRIRFESVWPKHLPNLPIAIMGEGSRQALAQYGINDATATIISPTNLQRTDSETLLDELNLPQLREKQVLIIRGDGGREFLADALRSEGVLVSQVTAYKRAAPDWNDERRAQLSSLLQQDAEWVVTSSEGLRVLQRWVANMDKEGDDAESWQALLLNQHLICPHVRIAEAARELGFERVTVTSSGDQNLLSTLDSSFSNRAK
jgi:uroporphyrinogen-III synthase